MAEFKGADHKKHEETNQEHGVRQKVSHTLSDKLHSWDQLTLAFGETPFIPNEEYHTKLLAMAHSDEAMHNLVMRLQKTYGNHYVQRLLNSKVLRAKLTVSDPNDVYEQEADRVAEVVTRNIASQVQRQEEEELLQGKALVQRQEEEEEELLQGKALVQRQEEEEELQMQPDEGQVAKFSDSIENRINNARGSGRPLADDIQEPMQQAFQTDFSDVRVHTDSEADVLNQQLNARAFTAGKDVFFRDGEYSPGSDSGRKLIAHELTHVVQQNSNDANRSSIVTSIHPRNQDNRTSEQKTGELHSNINNHVIIQRDWEWDNIENRIPADARLNLRGYRIVKMNTLPWTETWYRRRLFAANKKLETIQHNSKGFHEGRVIGASMDLGDDDALATIVHEAVHAGQHRQARLKREKLDKKVESKIQREIEAHLVEEQFRIDNNIPAKTAGIEAPDPSMPNIIRDGTGQADRDSVEAFVRWRYTPPHSGFWYKRECDPEPKAENFTGQVTIATIPFL